MFQNSQRKASIVLIDRTVDVASALGHHGVTLLDKVLAVNERLPGHHNDVIVNMAHLCNVNRCELLNMLFSFYVGMDDKNAALVSVFTRLLQ